MTTVKLFLPLSVTAPGLSVNRDKPWRFVSMLYESFKTIAKPIGFLREGMKAKFRGFNGLR
ncbi:hypothetical protein NP590_06180 [Methylomonas sp. SURF-2]|uniref:Uncharacterized protein n=1 Tax=Methylomonas subterranea TaxID=2952225 RepID=A0ABT1TE01_9GAMM|nr:hypothetical protein [Methylomonas sp. SURF-2]MCQ8103685.1 hypothetical protein [Methylomonas sp. SURF-2]